MSESIILYDTWELTKTSFVKGCKCLRCLYLDKHKKIEKTPVVEEKQARYKKGREFEDYVRAKDFPCGIHIKDECNDIRYFNSYTKDLLESPQSQILFEATIIEEEVLVMCDVLVKDSNGYIDIYEIKNYRDINDAILNDLAIQYYVCKLRFGNKLKTFNLVLRSNKNGEKWKTDDYKEELETEIDNTKSKIVKYKSVLLNGEPMIPMGNQCDSYNKCDFIEYCNNNPCV